MVYKVCGWSKATTVFVRVWFFRVRVLRSSQCNYHRLGVIWEVRLLPWLCRRQVTPTYSLYTSLQTRRPQFNPSPSYKLQILLDSFCVVLGPYYTSVENAAVAGGKNAPIRTILHERWKRGSRNAVDCFETYYTSVQNAAAMWRFYFLLLVPKWMSSKFVV
jgi:hypothetical protein